MFCNYIFEYEHLPVVHHKFKGKQMIFVDARPDQEHVRKVLYDLEVECKALRSLQQKHIWSNSWAERRRLWQRQIVEREEGRMNIFRVLW